MEFPPWRGHARPSEFQDVLAELDDEFRSLLEGLFQGLGLRGHRPQLMLQPGNLWNAPKGHQMFNSLAYLDTLVVAGVGVRHQPIDAGSIAS